MGRRKEGKEGIGEGEGGRGEWGGVKVCGREGVERGD